MEEIFETLRKQIKGGFDQNNIIIILDNSISLTCKKHPIPGTNNSSIPKPNTISRPINSSTMDKDLNLLSEELLEQIFVYLIDINWEEDQINEIIDQIWGIEKELELDKDLILLPNFPYINTYLEDYKYLVIYESPKYILLQDIPNQLYDYLEQIDLIPFQGYSTTFQELEYNYNYHIRYRTQRLKIQNQIEQESQQLIKNLILSNQINNVTSTQIKIQF